MKACACHEPHERRRVVLTSGPGAGKTAVLELIRQSFCVHVKVLEAAADAENPVVVLCDRGTVDGAAYWPGPDDFWSSVGTTLGEQLHRYDAVIHLRTPALASGYKQENPLRTESAAAATDERDRDPPRRDAHVLPRAPRCPP